MCRHPAEEMDQWSSSPWRWQLLVQVNLLSRGAHLLKTLRVSRMGRKATRFSRRHVKRTLLLLSRSFSGRCGSFGLLPLLPPSPGADRAGMMPGGMSMKGTWRGHPCMQNIITRPVKLRRSA